MGNKSKFRGSKNHNEEEDLTNAREVLSNEKENNKLTTTKRHNGNNSPSSPSITKKLFASSESNQSNNQANLFLLSQSQSPTTTTTTTTNTNNNNNNLDRPKRHNYYQHNYFDKNFNKEKDKPSSSPALSYESSSKINHGFWFEQYSWLHQNDNNQNPAPPPSSPSPAAPERGGLISKSSFSPKRFIQQQESISTKPSMSSSAAAAAAAATQKEHSTSANMDHTSNQGDKNENNNSNQTDQPAAPKDPKQQHRNRLLVRLMRTFGAESTSNSNDNLTLPINPNKTKSDLSPRKTINSEAVVKKRRGWFLKSMSSSTSVLTSTSSAKADASAAAEQQQQLQAGRKFTVRKTVNNKEQQSLLIDNNNNNNEEAGNLIYPSVKEEDRRSKSSCETQRAPSSSSTSEIKRSKQALECKESPRKTSASNSSSPYRQIARVLLVMNTKRRKAKQPTVILNDCADDEELADKRFLTLDSDFGEASQQAGQKKQQQQQHKADKSTGLLLSGSDAWQDQDDEGAGSKCDDNIRRRRSREEAAVEGGKERQQLTEDKIFGKATSKSKSKCESNSNNSNNNNSEAAPPTNKRSRLMKFAFSSQHQHSCLSTSKTNDQTTANNNNSNANLSFRRHSSSSSSSIIENQNIVVSEKSFPGLRAAKESTQQPSDSGEKRVSKNKNKNLNKNKNKNKKALPSVVVDNNSNSNNNRAGGIFSGIFVSPLFRNKNLTLIGNDKSKHQSKLSWSKQEEKSGGGGGGEIRVELFGGAVAGNNINNEMNTTSKSGSRSKSAAKANQERGAPVNEQSRSNEFEREGEEEPGASLWSSKTTFHRQNLPSRGTQQQQQQQPHKGAPVGKRTGEDDDYKKTMRPVDASAGGEVNNEEALVYSKKEDDERKKLLYSSYVDDDEPHQHQHQHQHQEPLEAERNKFCTNKSNNKDKEVEGEFNANEPTCVVAPQISTDILNNSERMFCGNQVKPTPAGLVFVDDEDEDDFDALDKTSTLNKVQENEEEAGSNLSDKRSFKRVKVGYQVEPTTTTSTDAREGQVVCRNSNGDGQMNNEPTGATPVPRRKLRFIGQEDEDAAGAGSEALTGLHSERGKSSFSIALPASPATTPSGSVKLAQMETTGAATRRSSQQQEQGMVETITGVRLLKKLNDQVHSSLHCAKLDNNLTPSDVSQAAHDVEFEQTSSFNDHLKTTTTTTTTLEQQQIPSSSNTTTTAAEAASKASSRAGNPPASLVPGSLDVQQAATIKSSSSSSIQSQPNSFNLSRSSSSASSSSSKSSNSSNTVSVSSKSLSRRTSSSTSSSCSSSSSTKEQPSSSLASSPTARQFKKQQQNKHLFSSANRNNKKSRAKENNNSEESRKSKLADNKKSSKSSNKEASKLLKKCDEKISIIESKVVESRNKESSTTLRELPTVLQATGKESQDMILITHSVVTNKNNNEMIHQTNKTVSGETTTTAAAAITTTQVSNAGDLVKKQAGKPNDFKKLVKRQQSVDSYRTARDLKNKLKKQQESNKTNKQHQSNETIKSSSYSKDDKQASSQERGRAAKSTEGARKVNLLSRDRKYSMRPPDGTEVITVISGGQFKICIDPYAKPGSFTLPGEEKQQQEQELKQKPELEEEIENEKEDKKLNKQTNSKKATPPNTLSLMPTMTPSASKTSTSGASNGPGAFVVGSFSGCITPTYPTHHLPSPKYVSPIGAPKKYSNASTVSSSLAGRQNDQSSSICFQSIATTTTTTTTMANQQTSDSESLIMTNTSATGGLDLGSQALLHTNETADKQAAGVTLAQMSNLITSAVGDAARFSVDHNTSPSGALINSQLLAGTGNNAMTNKALLSLQQQEQAAAAAAQRRANLAEHIYDNKCGLGEDMKFLASLPELCDITFLVGETREPVCAVKSVLAARSRVFHKILFGNRQINQLRRTNQLQHYQLSSGYGQQEETDLVDDVARRGSSPKQQQQQQQQHKALLSNKSSSPILGGASLSGRKSISPTTDISGGAKQQQGWSVTSDASGYNPASSPTHLNSNSMADNNGDLMISSDTSLPAGNKQQQYQRQSGKLGGRVSVTSAGQESLSQVSQGSQQPLIIGPGQTAAPAPITKRNKKRSIRDKTHHGGIRLTRMFTKRASDPSIKHNNSSHHQSSSNSNQNYLDKMSCSQMSTTMIIEEFEPDVFRQLIEYIHTGCVLLQARTLLGLLNAADYYGLEQLRKACLRFVSCCITVDTVCSLLSTAERYIQYKCTKSIVQKVLEFVDTHADEIFKLNAFGLLPEHVVRLILARDGLQADEQVKYNGVYTWCEHYCRSYELTNISDVMRNFLDLIQFHKIPTNVLLSEIYPTHIIPDNIFLSALAYQADPQNFEPPSNERARRMTLPNSTIFKDYSGNAYSTSGNAAADAGSRYDSNHQQAYAGSITLDYDNNNNNGNGFRASSAGRQRLEQKQQQQQHRKVLSGSRRSKEAFSSTSDFYGSQCAIRKANDNSQYNISLDLQKQPKQQQQSGGRRKGSFAQASISGMMRLSHKLSIKKRHTHSAMNATQSVGASSSSTMMPTNYQHAESVPGIGGPGGRQRGSSIVSAASNSSGRPAIINNPPAAAGGTRQVVCKQQSSSNEAIQKGAEILRAFLIEQKQREIEEEERKLTEKKLEEEKRIAELIAKGVDPQVAAAAAAAATSGGAQSTLSQQQQQQQQGGKTTGGTASNVTSSFDNSLQSSPIHHHHQQQQYSSNKQPIGKSSSSRKSFKDFVHSSRKKIFSRHSSSKTLQQQSSTLSTTSSTASGQFYYHNQYSQQQQTGHDNSGKKRNVLKIRRSETVFESSNPNSRLSHQMSSSMNPSK